MHEGEWVWRMGLWWAHSHTWGEVGQTSVWMHLLDRRAYRLLKAGTVRAWMNRYCRNSVNSEWRCTLHIAHAEILMRVHFVRHFYVRFSLFIYILPRCGFRCRANAPFSIHSVNLENFAVSECGVLQTPSPLPTFACTKLRAVFPWRLLIETCKKIDPMKLRTFDVC